MKGRSYSINHSIQLQLLLMPTLILCATAAYPKMPALDNSNDAAGVAAYKQGHFAEAERDYSLAVTEAEKLGPNSTRLATSLNSLAEVYKMEAK